uniref:Cytochrome P450 n=1 Tax=Kalanchoe fedtschenkoi TaxID=63787 RepID=A0A7N0UE57_KALFE
MLIYARLPPESYAAFYTALAAIIGISLIVKALRTPRLLLPPGPRGLPVLGYIPFLGTQLHLTFTKLGDLYGPIYKIWLGRKLCVILSSPDVVSEVVKDQDAIFANRDSTVASMIATYGGNDIGFGDYNPEWRKLRKIFMHKMLGNSTLDASFGLRREAVKKSVREVYGKIGTSVNIGQVGRRIVINGMVSMIWGGSVKGVVEGSDLQGLLGELMELVGAPNVSDFFPALAWLDLQRIEVRIKKMFDQIDRMFDLVIARNQENMEEEASSQESSKRSTDLLQYLMELKDSDDASSSISITQVKAMLMDIAVGGSDTTSSTLEWAMSELLLHPQAMKTVQEELIQVVGLDDLVTESHLPKLHYLDAVIKETQRLHPAFPLLVPRRPSQATEVGGYFIPEDTKVFINVYAMHRNPTLWDSPLEFRPERFLDGETNWNYSGKDMKYLPFGSGRRACPGIPLAERSLKYVLASFVHCFDWEVPKGVKIDLEEIFGITMRKKEPLAAIPTPRLSILELYDE